jgi:hypothetical protein
MPNATDELIERGLRAWTAGDLDALEAASGVRSAQSRGRNNGELCRLATTTMCAEPFQRD